MVITWNTFKKKENPCLYQTQDSTLGFVYTIEPTLKHLGYKHTREERNELSPKNQAIEMMPSNAKEGVYYVYRHSRGYCEYVELFWK